MIAAGLPVAAPSWGTVLRAWSLPPAVTAGIIASAGLYLWGVRRVNEAHPRHPFPRRRRNCFLAGLAALYLALGSPIEAYADTLFWVHMIEHTLLISVAAPLLMLGTPITLAIRAGSRRFRRGLLRFLNSWPVRVITFPVVTWAAFAAVLWATHFSGLFNEALTNNLLHDAEHLAFLFTACLWWWPLIGLDPGRWKLPHPARMLYVFAAAPLMGFLALDLYQADRVLYPNYAALVRHWGPSVLADQKIGAAIMWISGDVLYLAVTLTLFGVWMRAEERRAVLVDARLDARLDAQEMRTSASTAMAANSNPR